MADQKKSQKGTQSSPRRADILHPVARSSRPLARKAAGSKTAPARKQTRKLPKTAPRTTPGAPTVGARRRTRTNNSSTVGRI